jgi:hypothetical protein
MVSGFVVIFLSILLHGPALRDAAAGHMPVRMLAGCRKGRASAIHGAVREHQFRQGFIEA